VITAVDLDQLAQCRPPVPGLVDTAHAPGARNPKARVDHPVAQRLARDLDAVLLRELFARQSRTEVRVAIAHEIHDLLAKGCGQPPITPVSALARNESGSAIRAKRAAQTLDVA